MRRRAGPDHPAARHGRAAANVVPVGHVRSRGPAFVPIPMSDTAERLGPSNEVTRPPPHARSDRRISNVPGRQRQSRRPDRPPCTRARSASARSTSPFLEARRDREGAPCVHQVPGNRAALRGSLDLSAGPIAVQLGRPLRLHVEALATRQTSPKSPTDRKGCRFCRGLLEGWQELAARRPRSSSDDVALRAGPDRHDRERRRIGTPAFAHAAARTPAEAPADDRRFRTPTARWSARLRPRPWPRPQPLVRQGHPARLERNFLDDRELLISLQCQLEQIRRNCDS